MKLKTSAFIVILATVQAVHAQGFINLKFETTTISGGAATVPGWTWTTFYYSDTNLVPYNNASLSAPAVNLEGTNSLFAPAIQGNYSILIQGGDRFSFTTNGASIMQTAQIPVTGNSLTYWGGPLEVTFGGQAIFFNAISNAPNFSVWQADISPYAGQIGTLVFHAPWKSESLLDNIQFSSTAVPEPSAVVLAVLGVTLLIVRRR